MKRRINKPMVIFSVINLVFTILLTIFCIILNILPIKYIILLIVVLILFNIMEIFFLMKKRKTFKIIGGVISLIFVIVSIFGIYYISETNDFLNKAFNHEKNIYTNTYYIITKDDYNDINELNNLKIGYYEKMVNLNESITKLKENIQIKETKYEDLYQLFSDLNDKKISAVLIEQGLYEFVVETKNVKNIDEFKILHSFKIEIEEEIEQITSETDAFNIYIGGADFTNLYNDFNMIVTINKKTGQILLTSTPRDFYVELDGFNGAKDLLGYAAVWGINTSKKTLANLYDINIDYYVKINTKSLVGLVDVLGGIEFCSDISYTTTHATILDSYDDTKGTKLKVTKGCKKYSGVEILTIARERKAYSDGDRQRQINCQQIMINIFNQMIQVENLTNYGNILNEVNSLYTTNIPKELVTELAKLTLDGTSWKIEQQSVTGRNSSGHVHLSNVMDYVMVPDQDSVNNASLKIKMVESGK